MLKVGELTVSFTAMSADARAEDQDQLLNRLGTAVHRAP